MSGAVAPCVYLNKEIESPLVCLHNNDVYKDTKETQKKRHSDNSLPLPDAPASDTAATRWSATSNTAWLGRAARPASRAAAQRSSRSGVSASSDRTSTVRRARGERRQLPAPRSSQDPQSGQKAQAWRRQGERYGAGADLAAGHRRRRCRAESRGRTPPVPLARGSR